jgi:hypothetical protein
VEGCPDVSASLFHTPWWIRPGSGGDPIRPVTAKNSPCPLGVKVVACNVTNPYVEDAAICVPGVTCNNGGVVLQQGLHWDNFGDPFLEGIQDVEVACDSRAQWGIIDQGYALSRQTNLGLRYMASASSITFATDIRGVRAATFDFNSAIPNGDGTAFCIADEDFGGVVARIQLLCCKRQ